ncbi:DUF1648 domain-containing protein [Virgibacillus sp. W0181]|uniref:DUF1648 domain-containing protein n=1 Tax=Virgibacillus sp. W0181 TaxID=3391581 RepID=UPI003F448686
MNGGMLTLWISFILAGVIMPFMPYMTRKTENFGVSVPEYLYEREDFKKMRKQYTFSLFILLSVLIILCGILAYLLTAKVSVFIISIALIIYVAASFLLYLPFHFKMKTIKRKEKWQKDGPQTVVVDTSFREEKLIYSSWWFLLPGVLILTTTVITFLLYDQIPDQIPMHTDIDGNVRYDEKTAGNLLFMPGMQVFMLALFLFINLIIKHSKQQVSAANPDRSKKQNFLFRRRWSAYTIASSVLMVLLFGFIQFSFIYPALEAYTESVIITVIVLVLLGTIFLAIKTGQGGSRIKVNDTEKNGKIDHDDDRYWKLGQFYVNKNDPSIFVEKRFGVGWTNNWAHPLSWIFVIAIIVIPLIIVWILI